jgi:transcriptional regulator
MYVPAYFREERTEVLHAFMRRHPLGALVAVTADGLTANHIPMRMRSGSTGAGPDKLCGHVARANSVWRLVATDAPVLVIFGGADSYITPSWYATTPETGKVVPTWNYSVVHAYGRIRFIDDPAWLLAFVRELTDEHESTREPPWQVSDAPADYINQMVQAIVGFEIEVDRLVGKFKASQNQEARNREGVVAGLRESGIATDVAAELVRSPRR